MWETRELDVFVSHLHRNISIRAFVAWFHTVRLDLHLSLIGVAW